MSSGFDSSAHAQCRELQRIPWWVNGTLPPDEASAVAAHVAACASCTAESQVLRNLQVRMRGDAAVLLAPQSGWQGMVERLDDADLQTSRARPARARWHGRRSVQWPISRWQLIAAGQGVLAVGLSLTIWWQAREPDTESIASSQPAQYETLTSNSRVAAVSGRSLRMVFSNDATLTEVNALLRDLPAQVTDGPSEAGVYTVTLQGTQDDASLSRTLVRLRADHQVLFVEPVAGR